MIFRLPLLLTMMIGGTAPALSQPAVNCHAVDGDTIVCSRETIRIENIDAAEMPPHARCAYEADLAIRAKLFVGDRLARGRVVLERDQKRPRDRYGRTLALVKVDGVDRCLDNGWTSFIHSAISPL
jgi:endonuclease YncB( thermonuclease family)